MNLAPTYPFKVLAVLCCALLVVALARPDAAVLDAEAVSVMGTSLIPDGTYKMNNHPDGNAADPEYCLRIDRLFDGSSDFNTVTFSCEELNGVYGSEDDGTYVELEVNGSTITITGTVFGGRDRGTDYDPAYRGLWEIDFTYTGVTQVAGDDDLEAPEGSGTGTIKPLFNTDKFASGDTYYLTDYDGPFTYAFRLGNTDDDSGHRGFNGISGWGWVGSSENPGGPFDRTDTKDWLFTIEPICVDDPSTFPMWDGNFAPGSVPGTGVAILDIPEGFKFIDLDDSSTNIALLGVELLDGTAVPTTSGSPLPAIGSGGFSGFDSLTFDGLEADAPTQVKVIFGAREDGNSSFFIHFGDFCDRTNRVDPVVNLMGDASSADASTLEGDVSATGALPETFTIEQNYPNPFNPSTTIRYGLADEAQVRLAVYDLLGREVAVLVDGTQQAGWHTAVFEASNLPSGMYLARLEAGNLVQTQRMTLLK